MTSKQFRLSVKNKTPLKQKILSFSIGGLLSAGLIYYFIISIESESLWLPIVIFIVGLLVILYVVARLQADKKPLREEIRLTDEGIVSKVYGKIDFRSIHYMVKDDLAGEIYFLRIFLKSGGEHTWERSNAKKVSEESNRKLSEFCNEFIEAFKNFKTYTKSDFPRQHKFIFYKESGYFYGLLCFAFVPVLLVIDDINALGWWVLFVILIPVIGGLVLVFKKVVQKEGIALFENRMISKKYGQIDFQDISEIISSEDERRPGLTLKLKNGKSISWKTPTLGPNQSEIESKLNYARIRHFIDEFADLADQYSGTANLSTENNFSRSVSKPTSFQTSGADKKPTPQFSTASSATLMEKDSDQERRSIPHTRKKKSIYIGIPAGIAVSLLILGRNCTGEYQKKKSPFYQIDQKTENVQQQARSLLNHFTEKNGPYYIFTNQDSVDVFYYPTRKVTQKMDPAEVLLQQPRAAYTPEALQKSNQTMDFYREMYYAKQFPDSVNWQMLLQNSKTSISLQKSIFNQSDSTNTYLYLAYFIPDAPIERILSMRAYAKRKGLLKTEDKTGVFAIPIYKNSLIEDYLQSENFPLQHFLNLGVHFEDKMQIYITSQKQNGISETEFKKLAAEILKVLESEGMKTEGFKHKVFSGKK